MTRDNAKQDDSSAASSDFPAVVLDGVALVGMSTDSIARLPNFKRKTHHVPDQVNSHTQAFVAKLAADQVRADLDSVFASLRSTFRFTRKQLQSTDWGDGTGCICTPYFRYSSSVFQDADAPDQATWRREVTQIEDLRHVLDDRFNSVFCEQFDTVEVVPTTAIDLEEVIDRLESVQDERIWVEYDRHITFCEVTLEDHPERIRITPEAFQIIHPDRPSSKTLFDSLFRMQTKLLGANLPHDES